ncbi:MAG: hypothetical protein NUV80_00915 [Candidatus Berkelbacteria bacterium]|nr:hypothetical protein [Candidatus Berkelbacteria bacterium]
MRTLRLDAQEVVYLVSSLKNEEADFEDGKPLGKAVLLKLFSLFQDMTTDEKLVEREDDVAFTEPELWLLRGKVSPSAKMDGKLVGLKLLRKIHEALLSMNSVVSELPVSEVEEGEYTERKEEADARGETDEGDPKDDA